MIFKETSEKISFFGREDTAEKKQNLRKANCARTKQVSTRSSEEEHTKNALASGAEEGRDKLRKAAGRSKYP